MEPSQENTIFGIEKSHKKSFKVISLLSTSIFSCFGFSFTVTIIEERGELQPSERGLPRKNNYSFLCLVKNFGGGDVCSLPVLSSKSFIKYFHVLSIRWVA